MGFLDNVKKWTKDRAAELQDGVKKYKNRDFMEAVTAGCAIRITSYNVCYTKLLRIALRLRPLIHGTEAYGFHALRSRVPVSGQGL